MSSTNEEPIHRYLADVSSNIPFKSEDKASVLEELQNELVEEYNDRGGGDPIQLFGHPRETARKVVLGNTWKEQQASYKRRAIAYLIDFPFSLVLGVFFLNFYFSIVSAIRPNFFDTTRPFIPALTIFLVSMSVPMFTLLLYPAVFEHRFRTTPGKRLLGIYVIEEAGLTITFQQALTRSLTKMAPPLLLAEVLVAILSRPDDRRALDVIASTKVVQFKASNILEDYLAKVSRNIPGPKGMMRERLEELRLDLQEALADNQAATPEELFGPALSVARDLTAGDTHRYRTVSLGQRFVPYFIDTVVGFGLGVFLMLIPILVVQIHAPRYFRYIDGVDNLILMLIAVSIPFYILMAFPFLFEGKFSTSFGKWVIGLWVISNDGTKITWHQAFVRSLTKIFPLFVLAEVILGLSNNSRHTRALDLVSGTKVVRFRR